LTALPFSSPTKTRRANGLRTQRHRKSTLFAHHSEEEFAKLLDYYKVRWEYEPQTFVLETDESGNVKECFTPDFYLPDYDLYVEVTTLKPDLASRKNRKLRRLREKYPHVKIKLFKLGDFRKLMKRYGLDHKPQ